MILESSSPKKIEIMAGGASCAPKRWSFPQLATPHAQQVLIIVDRLNNAGKEYDELQVRLRRIARVKQVLVLGAEAPVVVLPEPLMPSNGFSCCKHTRPWWLASSFIISMVSRFSSTARFALQNTGASSCWHGATSLCLVFAATAKPHNSSSSSFMNEFTVGRMAPK